MDERLEPVPAAVPLLAGRGLLDLLGNAHRAVEDVQDADVLVRPPQARLGQGQDEQCDEQAAGRQGDPPADRSEPGEALVTEPDQQREHDEEEQPPRLDELQGGNVRTRDTPPA